MVLRAVECGGVEGRTGGAMPSFDIVSEVNHVEIRNAVDQCNKEISNRFDFKGSDARVEINEKEQALIVFADDEFKLRQVRDVMTGKLAKRGVDIRALEAGKMEPVSGNKVKETIKVREGIEQERAKDLVKLITDSKDKVQTSIQHDMLRVSGAKKDTLQDTIALVRKSVTDIPLQFKNFRDCGGPWRGGRKGIPPAYAASRAVLVTRASPGWLRWASSPPRAAVHLRRTPIAATRLSPPA